MKKRSGPEFRQQKRPLKRCPSCHGTGMIRPMFYEVPCDRCEASGVVCKETGDSLALPDLVLQLRIRLNEREQELADTRRRLAALKNENNGRGYGAGGSRYHGD